MRIGLLTGGGDCPGLNAIIRAAVEKSLSYGYEVVGIKQGWKGLLEPNIIEMNSETVIGIIKEGGTILKTSRTNPLKEKSGIKKVMENMKNLEIDALIAIGGDDTLGVAYQLYKKGGKVVGVPKTVDNDICGTDFTPGFDTAINTVMESIERLYTTAKSHNRTIVVEVMGRHAGWIATIAGMAAGADYIVIPEEPFSIQDICNHLKKRYSQGKEFGIVVVAEGAKPKEKESLSIMSKEKDAFGHLRLGGIAETLSKVIEKITGIETRHVVLGHVQRGGSPSAFDRVLGTRLGVYAVNMIKTKKFGRMAAIQRNKIVSVSLKEAIGKPNKVDSELYNIARLFFEK